MILSTRASTCPTEVGSCKDWPPLAQEPLVEGAASFEAQCSHRCLPNGALVPQAQVTQASTSTPGVPCAPALNLRLGDLADSNSSMSREDSSIDPGR